MTKEQWIQHKLNTEPHQPKGCPDCEARLKTRKALKARHDRDEAYKSCGLVKVRGALGGTYWE